MQWSGINDPSTWTATATSQSDYQIIPDGGDITGITGGEFGIVFLEKAIVRMSYIGSPFFFQFDTIARGLGCSTPNSISQYASTTFFLLDDGFYSCDGQAVKSIGSEKVDRFLFADVNLSKTAEGPLWAGSWPEYDKIMGPAVQSVLTGGQTVEEFGATICDEANKAFTQ